jgi:hypothetical protein
VIAGGAGIEPAPAPLSSQRIPIKLVQCRSTDPVQTEASRRWPTPGMVINPRQAAEALVMRLMSASIAATAVITAVRAAINPRMATERPAIPRLL